MFHMIYIGSSTMYTCPGPVEHLLFEGEPHDFGPKTGVQQVLDAKRHVYNALQGVHNFPSSLLRSSARKSIQVKASFSFN